MGSELTGFVINPFCPKTISHQIQLLQPHQDTRNILLVAEIVRVHTNQPFLGGTLFGTRRRFGRDAELVFERGIDDGRPDGVYIGRWDKEHPLWAIEGNPFRQSNEENRGGLVTIPCQSEPSASARASEYPPQLRPSPCSPP